SIERAAIARALEQTRWVVGGPRGAAARLGLKRTTLQSMMKRFGLPLPRERTDEVSRVASLTRRPLSADRARPVDRAGDARGVRCVEERAPHQRRQTTVAFAGAVPTSSRSTLSATENPR